SDARARRNNLAATGGNQLEVGSTACDGAVVLPDRPGRTTRQLWVGGCCATLRQVAPRAWEAVQDRRPCAAPCPEAHRGTRRSAPDDRARQAFDSCWSVAASRWLC